MNILQLLTFMGLLKIGLKVQSCRFENISIFLCLFLILRILGLIDREVCKFLKK